jgi:hypothetical protein
MSRMNFLQALVLILALCVAAAAIRYYFQRYVSRTLLQNAIAEADKSVISRFGLSYNRAQLAWSSESPSRAMLNLRRVLRWRFLGGVPSTRSERHYLGSGSETLESRLEIRQEHLHKVQLVATAGCVPAAEDWAQHVRAHFPHVEIVINGERWEQDQGR